MNNPVVALCCADLHLWHRPPVARSVEGNWLEVLGGYLDQLCALQKKHKPYQSPNGMYVGVLPVIIGGDIFDGPYPKPEVISLFLKRGPENIYGIPGNHDLPNHRYEEMKKSGYGVLVESGKITDLEPGKPVIEKQGTHYEIRLYGFPCGHKLKPNAVIWPPTRNAHLDIAVVHDYVWCAGTMGGLTKEYPNTGYQGAPLGKLASARFDAVRGYDISIWGDNHIPFEYRVGKSGDHLLYNCGGFLRRKINEKEHRPSVGIIYANGSVDRYHLDCSQDKFVEAEGEVAEVIDRMGADTFIQELISLADHAHDFRVVLEQLLQRIKVGAKAEAIILTMLEKVRRN